MMLRSVIKIVLFFGILAGYVSVSWALKLPLPPKGSQLAGFLQSIQVREGETFNLIAEKYDVGHYELAAANPQVDPGSLTPGTELIIPTQYLLPSVKRQGIVINLAAMRLFYFPKGKSFFYTYPVGIGRENWVSPVGKLTIIQKKAHPAWVVPESIYQFRKAHNDPVPRIVQAGPDNPLGDYAMRLSMPTYLIHGTNEPDSVGIRSSAGCIHLFPEDIKELFNIVPLHTSVELINQPFVLGEDKGVLMLQAYQPLQEQREEFADYAMDMQHLVDTYSKDGQSVRIDVDWAIAEAMLKDHIGIIGEIGTVDAGV
jgi:L,D-transpeptidase ErfK/SrfK